MYRTALFAALSLVIAIDPLAGNSPTGMLPADIQVVQQAQAAQKDGRHSQVVSLLVPITKKYPNQADLPRLLAHSYFELDRYDEARKAAIQAISLGRLSSDLLVRLVQIDKEQGNDLATLNTVRLLTIMESDNDTWRVLYGDLLMEMGRENESLAIYRDAIKRSPAKADWWGRQGKAQMQLNRPNEAIQSLETAWSLGERSKQVAQMLIQLYQSVDDPESAANWIDRLRTTGTTIDSTLRLRQAHLLRSIEQNEQAKAIAFELSTVTDKRVAGQAALLLGRIALDAGDHVETIKQWERAHAAGVDHSELLEALARLHFNEGNYTEAAKHFADCIAAGHANEDTMILAIRSRLRANDGPGARRVIRLYLERFGHAPQVNDLIRELASLMHK